MMFLLHTSGLIHGDFLYLSHIMEIYGTTAAKTYRGKDIQEIKYRNRTISKVYSYIDVIALLMGFLKNYSWFQFLQYTSVGTEIHSVVVCLLGIITLTCSELVISPVFKILLPVPCLPDCLQH